MVPDEYKSNRRLNIDHAFPSQSQKQSHENGKNRGKVITVIIFRHSVNLKYKETRSENTLYVIVNQFPLCFNRFERYADSINYDIKHHGFDLPSRPFFRPS